MARRIERELGQITGAAKLTSFFIMLSSEGENIRYSPDVDIAVVLVVSLFVVLMVLFYSFRCCCFRTL